MCVCVLYWNSGQWRELATGPALPAAAHNTASRLHTVRRNPAVCSCNLQRECRAVLNLT